MTNALGAVRHRRMAAAAVAIVLGTGACSNGDARSSPTSDPPPTSSTTSTTSTVPELPASTTTTAFDPASVEGQVEAAYLKSWDVYAHAVYHLELDEAAFAEVYAEAHLDTKRAELQARIAEGRAAQVAIEHGYTIEVLDETTAVVLDRYVNHQVLIDPDTKEPVEEDPNEIVLDAVTLRLQDGAWRVVLIEEIR